MPVTDIGIDLGSSNVVVYARGKGIVIREPSVAAYDKDADKILAFGEEARGLIDRTQGNIVAVRPLRAGVISDYSVTEKLLRHFIQKAIGRRAFRKPFVSICVPSGVTEVEKRAVWEATYQAGAREVTIVEETVAAAIGAGIDITKPVGNLIVDIGGATTKAAVISLGAPVVMASNRIGGDVMSDFKAGKMLGTSPRAMWIGQAIGALLGTVVSVVVLVALLNAYGADAFGPGKLFVSAQASVVATMVSGIPNVPAFVIGLVAGIVLYCLGLPSMMIGLGVYLPFYMSLSAPIGALVKVAYDRTVRRDDNPANDEDGIVVASGLLGGESIVGVVIALITVITGLAA